MDDQSRDYDGNAAAKVDVPAIGITLQYPLDDGLGRSLVFQTFVAADCQQRELNGALDKVRMAADRQRAIAMLPTLTGLVSDWEDKLKQAAEQHLVASTELDLLNDEASKFQANSGRRNPAPPASQVQARTRVQQMIASATQAVPQIKKELAVAQRKVEDARKLIDAGE